MAFNIVKVKSPCKDCKKRFVGCHDNCLNYIEYRQEIELSRQLKNKNRISDSYYGKKYEKRRYRIGNIKKNKV